MSIKNYNLNICITDLNTGDITVIHDYYKFSSQIKKEVLELYLSRYLDNNIPFSISYVYKS